MKWTIVLLACLLIGANCKSWADEYPFCQTPFSYPVSLQTTSFKVNIRNYMGVWFEIAHLPTQFQKDCACSQAAYTLNTAGYVDVENSCTLFDGSRTIANAKAYSRNSDNTKLEVYFQPNTPGNYWILEIDPYYNWVVVGEPCKKMAWIMSRTPGLAKDILAKRVQFLNNLGFETSKFLFRDTKC